MLSKEEKKRRLLQQLEQLEQPEEQEGPIDFQKACLERYGFYHPDFDFNVVKKQVIIKTNMLALKAVLDIMVQAGKIEPIRYSTGDRVIYLGTKRLQSIDVITLREALITSLKGEKISHRDVEEAAMGLAKDHMFDRISEYFLTLNPNNKDTHHIDTWLTDIFGAEDTPINRIIGKKWLVSAVARALQPGCYVEGALILYGTQAAGKSIACMTLAPYEDTYFGDFIDITNTQKACQTLQGKFVVEFSELASLNPKTIEDIKNWLTRKEDTYVEKYSNIPTNVQRQFVCIGTTNAATPLNDVSGNRRFWVIKVNDTTKARQLAVIKDELWYEALQLYHQWITPEYMATCPTKDPWVLSKEERELLSSANKDFEVPSSIADWLKQNFQNFVHTEDGYVKYSDIKVAVKKLENISDSRLSSILTLELRCLNKRLNDGSYYKYPYEQEVELSDELLKACGVSNE